MFIIVHTRPLFANIVTYTIYIILYAFCKWLCFKPSVTTPMNIRFPADKITNVSFVVLWDAIINQSVDRFIVNWSDGTNPIQSVIVHKISYTVTGLTPNTTYTITVAAVNMCGTGTAGNNSVTTNASFSVDATSTAFVFHDVTPTVGITTIMSFSVDTTSATSIFHDVIPTVIIDTTTNSLTYPTSTMNTTNPASKIIKQIV